mmetsp:Transcript_19468/g.27393  ORF Transcript_19468/g.27393 Transcript_19468/m.27393 type:complete len:954 (-) Transcript_19468:150-3011(-)
MAEPPDSTFVFRMTWLAVAAYTAYFFLSMAHEIRMIAINDYGTVIHEFDPYFNYRATEYLYDNGVKKFFTWFDYKSWYPLGRPVGTTIYPGMQFTAVILKYFLGDRMSLNDICCYIPVWFGVVASFLVGCIAYECSLECNSSQSVSEVMMNLIRSPPTKLKPVKPSTIIVNSSSPAIECGVAATGVMAIIPAHIMRSIGGGFDNESVAVSTMCLTFYFWVRSLRADDSKSYIYSILAGIAYFYMVATWGGYIFVLNMIGIHAAILILLGRFSNKIYLSYTLFYIVGTLLAMQIPVVGMTPLKSLEQLGPCVVFFGYQIYKYCDSQIKRQKLKGIAVWKYRMKVFIGAFIILAIAIGIFIPDGYFGPLSSRVRGLFVKHTKTGNPLVDSVAEHQPADNQAYFRYLQNVCFFAPIGLICVLVNFGDGPCFLVAYMTAAYFFSHRMNRLVLLMAPITSILAGIAAGRILRWSFLQWFVDDEFKNKSIDEVLEFVDKKKRVPKRVTRTKAIGNKRVNDKSKKSKAKSPDLLQDVVEGSFESKELFIFKRTASIVFTILIYFFSTSFHQYCFRISFAMSSPSIIFKAKLSNGAIIKVDDYRDAYNWINENTPEDARILAWWDYGYQIASIANRTTLADGNTWNHEHIALLGKILTTNVEEGYSIARHLADYVLVWAGGRGDDIAKSPHLARIANSVYRDMCPGDPTCREFGFVGSYKGERLPSEMMRKSFLYPLVRAGISPEEAVSVDESKFQEVYHSKMGMVRIYKILGVDEESKAWAADPKNRICDVEGGWYCRGQYPPKMEIFLSKKKDFAQLEDFNRKNDDKDYQKLYFENLKNPKKMKIHSKPRQNNLNDEEFQNKKNLIYNKWEDTDLTTRMWELIQTGTVKDLEDWLESDPIMAYIRSSDGRGPMWWAFEKRRQDMVKVLIKHGLSHTDEDKNGITPVELLPAMIKNDEIK